MGLKNSLSKFFNLWKISTKLVILSIREIEDFSRIHSSSSHIGPSDDMLGNNEISSMQKLQFQSLLANLAITEVATETNQETEDSSRTPSTQSSEETSARSIDIHNSPKRGTFTWKY